MFSLDTIIFWNKQFPEQVTNFQFVSQPLENLTTMWSTHELVPVHSVKYFNDCISAFFYFLNENFTLGMQSTRGKTSVRYFFIYNTKLVDHTKVSKLLKLVPQHIWVWCVTCKRERETTHACGTKILVVSWRVDRSMYGCLS